MKYVIIMSNLTNSIYKQLKSNNPKSFDKCKYNILTIDKTHKNETDIIIFSKFTENNKKLDFFLMKCRFKLVLNDYQ